MKKLLMVGMLIISAGAFAAPHHTEQQGMGMGQGMMMDNCQMTGNGKGAQMYNNMMSNLTPEQKKEMQKEMVQIQEKRLEVKKAMLEDKVDWTKVEKLNKEIGEIQAKHKTQMMKYMAEHPAVVAPAATTNKQ